MLIYLTDLYHDYQRPTSVVPTNIGYIAAFSTPSPMRPVRAVPRLIRIFTQLCPIPPSPMRAVTS